MIKHNFPFIPPPCGVHIAQSRGTFPDPPAQTFFDLLNPSRLRLIPSYRNRPQRRSPSQSGDICTTATHPLGLVRKVGGTKACFSSTRKGHSRYCPQNVCKLQSSYICGEIKNQIKNNEAYNRTKIGDYPALRIESRTSLTTRWDAEAPRAGSRGSAWGSCPRASMRND